MSVVTPVSTQLIIAGRFSQLFSIFNSFQFQVTTGHPDLMKYNWTCDQIELLRKRMGDQPCYLFFISMCH